VIMWRCYLTVDPETHMLRSGLVFMSFPLKRKNNNIMKIIINIQYYSHILFKISCVQISLFDTVLEFCKKPF
jgi:hypothetical protein